jgi:hypothetical protein
MHLIKTEVARINNADTTQQSIVSLKVIKRILFMLCHFLIRSQSSLHIGITKHFLHGFRIINLSFQLLIYIVWETFNCDENLEQNIKLCWV